ncbi:MAG: glycosyltransferase [Bacteroidaceae bacterium]|nr:glycosyltransferase [Bacteroidaceae bacterium]
MIPVSIVVITYNSSKYVLETLESVKAQDYPNIELIVSDDRSTDNTFELVNQWIEEK